jgi:hypothetical protein
MLSRKFKRAMQELATRSQLSFVGGCIRHSKKIGD